MISDPSVQRVYIFFGSAEVDTIPDVILDKPENLNYFGYRVSLLGDINGDSYKEVAVSSFSLDIDSCKVLIYTSNPTSIYEREFNNTLKHFCLKQNYPNPFNSSTIINYQIIKKGEVKLTIYNVLGERINTIIDDYQMPKSYHVDWDGTDYKGKRVASGIYFYELKWNNQIQIKKLVFLK
ncbi:MAG: T9SS type A sorting domain-containing protein [Candidatus Zixiibacteriota bacterium]